MTSTPALAILALCFAAVLLDGLDTSSIGVAGPAIAAHFGVEPAALTGPFVMTSIGAVIGYLISGPFVERWNARRVMLTSVFAFGALSLATPHAGSIVQLAVLRLLTAIGLGAALPAAISVAIGLFSPRWREAVTVVVAAGLSAGGIFGGVLGGTLTKRFGWECLFYAGGALPLILWLCLWQWLPTDTAGRTPAPGHNSKEGKRGFGLVKSLIAEPAQTIALWTFSFLIFADAYALVFWLPSLLIKSGSSTESAQFAVGVFSAGGLLANVVVIALVSRFAVVHVMLLAVLVAALCVAGVSLDASSLASAWPFIAGAGAGLVACSVGQSALAVSIYPRASQTTGVGFSAAAGRVGSVVGPAVVGLLFSLQWPPKSIVLAATAPILIALLALALLTRAMPPSSSQAGE